MGCAGSKLDDLHVVALCRERTQLLEAAIFHRYSLAQAHISYLHSLKSVASSLQRFFDLDDIPLSPSSPFLPLPTQRKGDPDPGPGPGHGSSPELIKPSSFPPIATVHHSHSNSGGHVHFHTDSDSDGSGSPHSGNSSPLHAHETLVPSPPRYYYMNYARGSAPTQSISYEQRPRSPDTVHFSESSYSALPNPNPTSSYIYSYSNYGGSNTFFGSPPPAVATAASSSSHLQPQPQSQSPPPPPSPKASTWDFLNPFETTVQYYPPYTPSRDSKEVRDEEGIPDLEEEESHKVVKEVHLDQKFIAVESSGGGDGYSKVAADEGDRGIGGEVVFGMRSSPVGESNGVEHDVHLVHKNVVANEDRSAEDRGNVATFKARVPRGVSEAVSEIKAQFDRASDSGNEVSKILEVGKLPYRGKNAVYKVSSRMLDVITPLPVGSSYTSTSFGTEALPSTEIDSLAANFKEDMRNSKSLSSTLEKLYIWEKKLYEEVKAEEKMQIIHERKCRRLKHLDERGAEAHKIKSTRTLVRNLSAKIRIALQFVDSISNKINNLRDEDLWLQIDELIQGLVRMWKVMLECHQCQYEIITEARNLDDVASGRKLSDAHMEATMQFEQELLNWILSFYAWISAQKSYVKALNGWLLMCIHYEPELTADGIIPFSPGRIGAPPVFVICNHWSQVMDRISENEVFEAMQTFSVSVLQLLDEQRQRMMTNKDMDRRLKFSERDEQKMQKALDIVNKKLALVSEQNGLPSPGKILHQSHSASDSSLQSGLKQIFEAMEKFSNMCMKAYEELHLRSEEDRLARENVKVP